MAKRILGQMLKAGAIIGLALAGTAVCAGPTGGDGKIRDLPNFLSESWHFTQEVKPENFSRIPAGAKTFKLDPETHGIDLDTIRGKKGKLKDECIIYNEFELKQDELLGFGIGADWWVDVFLNGERIFTTFPYGNMAHPCSPDDFGVGCKGRKGRNLLAVRVRRGGVSWAFCMQAKAHPSAPVAVSVDPGKVLGRIKAMNGVNNGPIRSSRGRGNMKEWKAAAIPYVRNHDASFHAEYGGEHTVDVHLIFPDFSKDPEDPASYHFSETDRYLKTIIDGGSKVFYRLGSKIEHSPEKYGTRVPADFKKWAVICEHIIRHYNEGWANGFKWDIRYWEIWAEPDLGPAQNGTSPTWQGTPEQFHELFRVTATHLKRCFPKLKIGGPALAGNLDWMQDFLRAMTAGGKRVPMDFFSWHSYTVNPLSVKGRSRIIRKMLDDFGYTASESILDEWNYVRGWEGEDFKSTVRTIIGLKGAAYAGSVLCTAQNSPVDMLMYYDARPSVYNGLFGYYNFEPLKTYYVFLAWSKLVGLGSQIAVDTQGRIGLYAVAAEGNGKVGVLLSRFFEENEVPAELPVMFSLKDRDLHGVRLYRIDENHDLTEIPYRMDQDDHLLFTLKANTVVYLEK